MTIEDRVKDRLATDTKTAEKAVTEAKKDYGKAAGATDTAIEKYQGALAKALDGEKAPTEAQATASLEAARAIGKATTAVLKAKAALVKAEADATRLADPKELTRRLGVAKKLGKDATEPMSGTAAAEAVLLNAGKPLHYTEITKRALESGVIRLNGKTPEATMSAYLAKATAKGDTFVRVDAGIFDLKARATAKA